MRGFVLLGLVLCGCRSNAPVSARTRLAPPPSQALTTWPWAGGSTEQLTPGLECTTTAAPDGTRLELYEADLTRVALRLYDQDTDHDNSADISRTVDQLGLTKALLAWNGPFFAYDFSAGKAIARHIAPVVQNGIVRHNVGQHRWTLGWTGSRFTLLHSPGRKDLEAKHFQTAVSGVQALIVRGKPLKLEPFPTYEDQIRKAPVPSTPEEAGHIPLVDHMRTSRTSLAWSKDGKYLYVLFVFEPDHELGSKLGLKRGQAQEGGWTLADLQRFWISFGAFGAINSDGGDVTQRWRPGDFVPPKNRLGTLMSFYLRPL